MCEKIQGTYFKISALCFLQDALCFFSRPKADEKCLVARLELLTKTNRPGNENPRDGCSS